VKTEIKGRKVKTEIIGIHAQASHNGRLNERPDDPMNNVNENGVRTNNDPAAAKAKGADTAPVYSRVVEQYALFFDRPETRLRFVNNTLAKQAARQERLKRRLGRFRFFERTRFYDNIIQARCYSAILEELRSMRSSLPKDRRRLAERIQAPFSARLFFLIHQARHAFYAAMAVSAVMTLLVVYSFGMLSARSVNKYLANRYRAAAGAAPSPTPTPRPVEEKIFFYGTDERGEKWSNGLTILTKYETGNRPRAYYTFPRNGGAEGAQKNEKVAGILYHTPESYMVDFIPDKRKAIQKSSQGLLEYVRDRKLYNYVITRVGEIYRIIPDDHTANHAGESLWADDKNTYVLLNESFIGVCFEAKFDGATSVNDILTPAQIRFGKMLTDVLRTKHRIDDANCTTHGLVAVDPNKMLIARHHDWVRFFPFDEMGLSDKYKILPPAIADYGFTYDDYVMAKIGNQLWEGATVAGEEFRKRAARAGISLDDLRRQMRERYISQRNRVYGLHPSSGDANDRLTNKTPSGAAVTAESSASQSISDSWKTTN
jgi:hypothetical protein